MIAWEAWLLAAAKVAAAVAAGLLLQVLLFRALGALGERNGWRAQRALLPALRSPARILLALIALLWLMPALTGIDAQLSALIRHGLSVAVIATLTWLAAALVDAGADVILGHYDMGSADNLEARRMYTQMMVLERVVIVTIVIVGTAAALMTFPRVRDIGTSLLVSAGFAGLALGLAARPVLENLISGLQLAFTQPIRVDDVVIVEGEWGRVEEITATYVVVRIWDDRRLIVPFAHFISQPFQNWTRRTADILGTIFLHVDYRIPVAAVRAELQRLCAANALWDGRVCVLQVTEAGERTLQLRALVSAADSGRAWDLRVALREQLVEFLQREFPDCLPRTRIECPGRPDGAGAAEAGA